MKNLLIYFLNCYGDIFFVDNISFIVNEGEMMGLVGEFGCGKLIMVFFIMGLLLKIVKIMGEIFFIDCSGK